MLFKLFPQEPLTHYNIPGFLADFDIDNILNNIEYLKTYPSKIVTTKESNQESSQIKKVRSSDIKWIPQAPPWLWLYQRIHDYVINSNNLLWNFTLSHMDEEIQYSEYNSSQNGHYDWHIDMGIEKYSTRKLSIIVQLSSPKEYEGGDVEFFTGGDLSKPKSKISKEMGSITIFPSYMLHRVTPVTKGVRKSLAFWVGGTQFR